MPRVFALNGAEHELRPLTMGEVRKVRGMGEDEADVTAIAWSAGVLPSEVQAWFDTAPAGDVIKVIRDVFDVSGLGEGAGFPG